MPELAAWIAALAGRLARHELASLGPITLRDGSRFDDTERAVRIMLADLNHLDRLLVERRQDLLDDFRHLRKQLG
jgi:hypothetical protein